MQYIKKSILSWIIIPFYARVFVQAPKRTVESGDIVLYHSDICLAALSNQYFQHVFLLVVQISQIQFWGVL